VRIEISVNWLRTDCGNDPWEVSGSVKDEGFLDHPSYSQRLKKDSAA